MKHFIYALPLAALPALGVAHEYSDRLHDLSHFFETANIVAGHTIVECTLSGGAETSCFSITVKPEPTSYEPGPWCPTSVNDTADAGGIWFKDGEVLDVDGAFITKLAELYNDDNWKLFDEATGQVRVTDTLESCLAAARPNVDPEYQNHCVQCLLEYVDEDHTMTYVIPLEPQPSEAPVPTQQAGSGVALNGIRLDGPAPVDAILSAYTIAAFDDCGGHVNEHVGYHYHAVTDCLTDGASAETDTQVGIAMDGYPIYEASDDPAVLAQLDACHGYTDDVLGYHYRAGAPGGNLIVGCLTAQVGCVMEGEGGTCDATAVRHGPPPGGARPPRAE